MQIEKIEITFLHKGSLENTSEIESTMHQKILPCLSVVRALEGYYEIQIDDGENYVTKEGSIFVIPSFVRQTIVHHVNPLSKKMRADWVFLNAHINNRIPFENVFSFPVVLPQKDVEEVNAVMDKLTVCEDACERMIDAYTLLKLLLSVSRPKEAAFDEQINRVLNYVGAHFQETLSVETLAAVASVSPSYLFSLFKKTMGCSPIAYVNHLRLSVAAEMLRTTNTPINRIADQVGFGDAFYFSKMFKQKYALSPKEYRARSASGN